MPCPDTRTCTDLIQRASECVMFSTEEALTLIVKLLACLNNPTSTQDDYEIVCAQSDGRPIIARIVTGGPTQFFEIDGITPYAGVTVSCGRDFEEVQSCREITVAGAYGAVGDRITQIRFFDATVVPPTLVATVFVNETTGLVVTGVDTTNSVDCSQDSVIHTEKLCDACIDEKSVSLDIDSNGIVNNVRFNPVSQGGFVGGCDEVSEVRVDWGDGTPDTVQTSLSTPSIQHLYATAGTYTITVSIQTNFQIPAVFQLNVTVDNTTTPVVNYNPFDSNTGGQRWVTGVNAGCFIREYLANGTVRDVDLDGNPYTITLGALCECPEFTIPRELVPISVTTTRAPAVEGYVVVAPAASSVTQPFSVPMNSVTVWHDAPTILEVVVTGVGINGSQSLFVPPAGGGGGAVDISIVDALITAIDVVNPGAINANVIINGVDSGK